MTPRPEIDPSDVTIQQVSSRIVYQNPWMRLREDVIRRPDGSQGIYSYVDKPDFALIIPVERDGFHLIEQYRYPVSHRSWEFPQGTLPNREDADPTELARRELAEETGLRARHMHRLGYVHPAKGMSRQACTVFIAEELEAGQHARENEEQDMRQHWFTRTDLEGMIQTGTITDAATSSAYLLYRFSDRNRGSHG
ncbi:MAG: NUDIX domain-containing protein [Pseudonocardiaceae bacterium]